ncbi:rhomboid family intramembrane serine protease [Antrihabitans cavernicola]|nr:rhomboid family intramembrane serine protease [Spelaeibacter cavernicola]
MKPPRDGRPLWMQAAAIIVAFTVLLYAIEAVDVLANHRLDQAGVEPREVDGLWGILFAPMLHFGWGHLIANTIPMLVLGFLSLMAGIARGITATAVVWIVGGIGTWLTGGSGSVHIGASVLIFGWLTFLLARGIFNRSAMQILIGLVVLVFYGSLLWGVLPSDPRISWQGHLFGAIGGLIAAWVLSSDQRAARRKPAVAG